ncbi:MAG: hypothetical protein JW779_07855 [Candidatus Thorarchaeota archaeon]|nr:hypothetical protein [Candidatus Thorarchaeota archaeon]
MLLETIIWNDEEFHVGISEIMVSKQLDRDVLLNLASMLSEKVFALQFFNSAMIVDEVHLLSAAQNAMNAMKGNYMISRTFDVEIAIYASAQHQIGRALEMMGVTDDTKSVCVVIVDLKSAAIRECMSELIDTLGQEAKPQFKATAEKISDLMRVFNISEVEMNQFTNDLSIDSRKKALLKCVVSRVSQATLAS